MEAIFDNGVLFPLTVVKKKTDKKPAETCYSSLD